jgi:hypothetical protein
MTVALASIDSSSSASVLGVGEIARLNGLETWKVQSVINRGWTPRPSRVGRFRVFAVEQLPAVEAALRRAGYIA